jgi:hypothetical protein
MDWSKLKQRTEARTADSIMGRVQFYNARYTHAHDGDGRGWITVDGREIANFCDHIARRAWDRVAADVLKANAEGWKDATPEQLAGWRNYETARWMRAKGKLGRWEFNEALERYLSLPIYDALVSEEALIRALAMIDRRVGKRRLQRLAARDERQPLVRMLYELRCEAEGIPFGVGPGGVATALPCG